MTFENWLGDQSYDEYYRRRLAEANNQLSNYPALANLFGSLSYPSDEHLQENPLVFRLAKIDRGEGGEEYIQMIDRTLDHLTSKLSSDDTSDLKQELRSEDRRVASSRLLELQSHHFFAKQGLSVTPEPDLSTGGQTDLRVNDDHPVYIEVTRLGTADIEISIEELFESVAKELIDEIPDDTLLHVNVDTSRLAWDPNQQEALQRSESKKRVLDQFHAANLGLLLEYHDAVSLRDIQDLGHDWTIQDLIDDGMLHIINQYTNLGEKIKQHEGNPKFGPVRNTSIDDFHGPIISAFTRPCNGKLVEVHSENVYPSQAATEQKRVFLNRVETNVESKIQRNQREPGEPNLLFISATNWLARGYSHDEARPISDAERQVIKQSVETVLDREQPANLVGVGLTEDDPAKHIFINNPYTDDAIEAKFAETETSNLMT